MIHDNSLNLFFHSHISFISFSNDDVQLSETPSRGRHPQLFNSSLNLVNIVLQN
jgi:hypothetical protein